MQVRQILDIKGTVLYTIAPDKKLSEAIAIMSEQDVGSLVCFEGGRMVGMLTFREVMRALHGHGAAWGGLTIREVMHTHPRTADPFMDVDQLRALMVSEHMRYLPVMDGYTLLGVISFHDVAKAVLEEQNFENRMLKAYIRDWPDGQEPDGANQGAKA
ncbi:MAG: CBS domain-containing protein [Rhodocyclaceae bacterium]|nr:CBS domain-containing protein [Rhodocyclaceae bacterium]MDZ4214102.1 CBS domain-containing protein [Rhodocyclaceae bacterium]